MLSLIPSLSCSLWPRFSFSGVEPNEPLLYLTPASTHSLPVFHSQLIGNRDCGLQCKSSLLFSGDLFPFLVTAAVIKILKRKVNKHIFLSGCENCRAVPEACCDSARFGAVFQSFQSAVLCIGYYVKVMPTSVTVPGDVCRRRNLLTAGGQGCDRCRGTKVLLCVHALLYIMWRS